METEKAIQAAIADLIRDRTVIAIAHRLATLRNANRLVVVEEGIKHGCEIAMIPMLILMLVGVLIASLIAAGTIPTLIYYGLKIINPSIFLFTAALVCSIASMAGVGSFSCLSLARIMLLRQSIHFRTAMVELVVW